MPTSKKSAESEVGEAKPVHEHGQRFRLMAPPGFKKFAVLVGALAGLTSPAPISFINNEGGNIVMASPVFKEKKKPEEKINELAKDAAYALLRLFKTGDTKELEKMNKIFNEKVNGKAVKYQDAFQAEFTAIIISRTAKDKMLRNFVGEYQKTLSKGEKFNARDFVTAVADLYTAESYEAAVEKHGKEFTDAFINFSTKRIAYNIVKLYVDALEDFDKLPQNIKNLEKLGKAEILGVSILEYEEFGKAYAALYEKKIVKHEIYKEYYSAYVANEMQKMEAQLEAEYGKKVKVNEEDLSISSMDILRAIEESIKLLEKGDEGKKEAKKKYGTLFVYALGKQYVSKAPSAAEDIQQAAIMKDEIAVRHNDIKKDIKKLEKLLKDDMFNVLQPILSKHIAIWRAESNAHLDNSEKIYADLELLGEIEKDQKELEKSIIKVEDLVEVMKLAYYMIDVAETGDAQSRQKVMSTSTYLTELKVENPEKYEAVDDCLKTLLMDRNPELFELVMSKTDETTFEKIVEVGEAYHKGDEEKLALLEAQYGKAFVKLVTHPDATWLTDPEKASYDYMQNTVKERIPTEVAYQLIKYKFQTGALKFVYNAVALGDEKQIQQAEMFYGKEFVASIAKNMDYLEWIEGASDVEVRDTANARLLLILGEETYEGEKKTSFIENAVYMSGQLYSFYNSYNEVLDQGIRPGDKYDIKQYKAFVEEWKEKLGGNYGFEQILDFDTIWANSTLRGKLKDAGAKSKADIPEYLYTLMEYGENEKQTFKDGIYDEYIESDEEMAELYPDMSPQDLEDKKFSDQYLADAYVQVFDNLNQYEIGLFMSIAEPALQKNGLDGKNARTAVGKAMATVMDSDPYLITSFLTYVVPGVAQASADEETFILALGHAASLFETRQVGGAQDFKYSKQEMRPYFKQIFYTIGNDLPSIITELNHKMLEDEMRWGVEPGPYQMPIDPNLYKVKPGFWEEKGLGIPKLYGAQPPVLQLKPKVTMPLDAYLPYGPVPIDSGATSHFNGMWNSLYPPTEKMFHTQPPNKFHIGAVGKATIIDRLNKMFGPMPVDYSSFWLSHIGDLGAYAAYEKEGKKKELKAGATWETMHKTMTGGITEKGKVTTGTEIVEEEPGVEAYGTKDYDVDQQFIAGHIPGAGTSEIHKLEEEFTFEATQIDSTEMPAEFTKLKTEGLLDSYTRLAEENKTDMLVFVNGTHLPELKEGINKQQFVSVSEAQTSAQNAIDAAQDHIDDLVAAGEDVSELQNLLNQAQDAFATGTYEGYVDADYFARQVTFEPTTYQEKESHLRSKLYFITEEGDIYQLALGADTEMELLNYFYGSADTEKILGSFRFMGENFYKLAKDETTEPEKLMTFDGAAFGMTVGPYSSLYLYNVIRSMGDMEPYAVEQATGQAIQFTMLDKPKYQKDIFAAFYRGAEALAVEKGIDPVTGLENETVMKVGYDKSVTQTVELMWRHIPPNPKLDPSWELRVVGGYPMTAGAKVKTYFPKIGLHVGGTAAVSEQDYLYDYAVASEAADQISAETRNWLIMAYGWKENEAKDAGFFLGGSYLLSQMQEWKHYDFESIEGEVKVPKSVKQKHYWSALFMAWAQKHNFLMGAEHVPEIASLGNRINDAMQDIQQNPENAKYIMQGLQKNIDDSFMEDIWRFSLGWGYDGKGFKPYVVGGVELMGGEVKKVSPVGETEYYYELQQMAGNIYALILMGEPHEGFPGTQYPGKAYVEVSAHIYDYTPKLYEEDMDTGQINVSSAGNFNYADFYFGVGSLGWPSTALSWEKKNVKFTNYPEGLKKKFNKEAPLVTGDELEATMKANKKELLMELGALTPKMSDKEIEMQLGKWSILQSEHLMASKLSDNTFYMRVSPRTIDEGAMLSLQIGTIEDYHQWINDGLVLGSDLYRVTLTKDGVVLFGDKKMTMFESFKVIGGITVPVDPEDQSFLKTEGWSVGALAHIFKTKKADILAGALYGYKEFGGETWEGWTMALSTKVQGQMTSSTQEYHYAYLFVDSLTKEAKVVTEEEIGGEIISAQKKMSDAERITAGVGYTYTKINIERGDQLKIHFFFEGGKELKRGKDLGLIEEAPKESFIGRAGFKFEQSVHHGTYTWFISAVAAKGDWPYMPATITKPEYFPMWKSTIDYASDEHMWFMISAGIRW